MSGKAEVMILCAGNGTRLGDLTLDTPKVMLPVAGKPALQWTIESLARQGIRRVVINLCRLADMVTYHFGDGSRFGLEIRYSLEETLLGTAGGIKRALPMLADSFRIILGDVLSDIPLACVHSPADITLAAHVRPRPWECGCLVLDGNQVVAIHEKPSMNDVQNPLVFAGVARLTRQAVRDFPPYTDDLMGEALPLIMPRYRMQAVCLPREMRIQDIGTPEGYQRAQELWRAA